MRICVIVINSVWYDPRVRKQIAEYIRAGHEVRVVGHRCARYDKEKIEGIPAPTNIVYIEKYAFIGRQGVVAAVHNHIQFHLLMLQ